MTVSKSDRSRKRRRLGVDLGGTKISVGVLDPQGATLFHKRAATPRKRYEDIIGTIADLVLKARRAVPELESAPVGVGIPGALETDDDTVKNANTQCLIGRPLKSDLAKALGVPVSISNDATCFATSEAVDGAAAGARVVFGVILGTGVGGGLVLNGAPWDGPNRLAGEWGHNPFPHYTAKPKVRDCYCGKRDCIETRLSGPALERDYCERAGTALPADEIAARAGSGDATAKTVIDDYIDSLAQALSMIINLIDPEVIVLGGGLSNLDRIYVETPRRWGRYAFNASTAPAAIRTKLVKNRWGDDSGLRGAAWLT